MIIIMMMIIIIIIIIIIILNITLKESYIKICFNFLKSRKSICSRKR